MLKCWSFMDPTFLQQELFTNLTSFSLEPTIYASGGSDLLCSIFERVLERPITLTPNYFFFLCVSHLSQPGACWRTDCWEDLYLWMAGSEQKPVPVSTPCLIWRNPDFCPEKVDGEWRQGNPMIRNIYFYKAPSSLWYAPLVKNKWIRY